MSAEQYRQACLGAAVIFLDAPRQLKLGIDFAEWTPDETHIGQSVQGQDRSIWVITGLDPGSHFTYWESDTARNGELVHLAVREVAVFKWQADIAVFIRLLDEEEVERFRVAHENLSLLTNAIVYPSSMRNDWAEISYCVTKMGIRMLQGGDLTTRITTQEYEEEKKGDPQMEKFEEGLSRLESACPFNYTDVIKYNQAKTTLKSRPIGDRLTSECMDRTGDLSDVLERLRRRCQDEGGDGALMHQFQAAELASIAAKFKMAPEEVLLLGELQVSFIALHLKFDVNSLDQWRRLLVLLANSESLCSTRLGFGAEFIRTLYAQVNLCSEDILLSDITKSNFIVASIVAFVEICEDCHDPKLRRRLKLLKEKVEQKFKMSITEMWLLQEDAPQIAEDGE